MNAHRRAWTLRVGVIAALAAATLTSVAAPAQADSDINVSVSTNVRSGETTQLQFQVVFRPGLGQGRPPFGQQQQQESLEIKVESSDDDVLECQGENCGRTETFTANQPRQFTATLKADDVDPGETETVTLRITVDGDGDDNDNQVEQQITVRGPDRAPSVTRVSGQILDAGTGDGVPGALVAMQDSTGRPFSTEADDNGRFTFTASQDRPIAPGRIDIAVGKDGYGEVQKNFQGRAGQALADLRISLTSTAEPSAEPTPEDTGGPADEPPATQQADAQALDPTAGEESDTGTLIFILVGGLLVALGVGAFVLLLVRRRQEKAAGMDGDADDDTGPRGPVRSGAYRSGADDATRVVSGLGMGGLGGTVVPAGLADAPTMLQTPVRDEFPDPYGAPPGVTPTYGATSRPDWDDDRYADATQVTGYPGAEQRVGGPGTGAVGAAGYGRPTHDTGYGARDFEDRGPADRFDEPTGMFTGGADAPAGGRATVPAPPLPGRAADTPYESGYRADGYDRHAGYGGDRDDDYPVPSSGGGYQRSAAPYGAADDGGYGAPRGRFGPASGTDGYDTRGDFDDGYRSGGGQGGGYEARRAGYGGVPYQAGGYGDNDHPADRGTPPSSRHVAPPPASGRSERRSLDWLDD